MKKWLKVLLSLTLMVSVQLLRRDYVERDHVERDYGVERSQYRPRDSLDGFLIFLLGNSSSNKVSASSDSVETSTSLSLAGKASDLRWLESRSLRS
jgi:hypothetical protein